MAVPDIKALTGLRGYAAVGVCVFHYTLPWTNYDNWAMPLARHGNYGVMLFFVLSGFILSYVYFSTFEKSVSARSFGSFMWHRFCRIYPLHIFLFLLTALLILFAIQGRNPQNDDALSFVLNIFLLHGWGYPNSVSWNMPSWSISVELFAYLLFPLLALLLTRAHWLILAFVAAAVFYGPFYYLQMLSGLGVDLAKVQFAYAVALVNFFSFFVLGMLAFQLVHRYGRYVKSEWLWSVVVIAGIMWLIWRGEYQNKVAEVPYASALLIMGLYHQPRVGNLLMGNRLSIFLGDTSYALYLSHPMVYVLLLWALRKFGLTLPDHSLLMFLIVAIAVSAVLHYAIERPARAALRALPREWERRRSKRKEYDTSAQPAVALRN